MPSDPLRAMFRHLEDWPDATREDELAFRAFMREWTLAAGVWIPLFFLVCVALWWPLDWLVFPSGKHVAAFTQLRVSATVLFAVYAVVFRTSDLVRRHVYPAAVFAYAMMMGAIGHALGRLGPDAVPWLADAYIGVVPAAMIPMRLPERVAATFVVATTLPASFFLMWPANLAAPTAMGQVSFAVFAAVLSVVIGEVMLRTVRRSFMQARSIAREREDLAQIADTLALRVSDQTRELHALAAHLQHTQEAQRRSLSRALHANLGEELNAMRLLLEAGAREVDVAPHKTTDVLIDLSDALSRTTHVVRTMVADLQPEVLSEQGLEAALQWLVDRAQHAEQDAILRMEPAVASALDDHGQTVLFRAVQEALTNTRRHAEATVVRVSVRVDGDDVEAVIEDDGVGLDVAASTAGFGLAGIRHAVEARGGALEVFGEPGVGTRVVVRLPITRRTVPT